jgi:uncharacterized protein YnzC (UPF0291/DUF896 family)
MKIVIMNPTSKDQFYHWVPRRGLVLPAGAKQVFEADEPVCRKRYKGLMQEDIRNGRVMVIVEDGSGSADLRSIQNKLTEGDETPEIPETPTEGGEDDTVDDISRERKEAENLGIEVDSPLTFDSSFPQKTVDMRGVEINNDDLPKVIELDDPIAEARRLKEQASDKFENITVTDDSGMMAEKTVPSLSAVKKKFKAADLSKKLEKAGITIAEGSDKTTMAKQYVEAIKAGKLQE